MQDPLALFFWVSELQERNKKNLTDPSCAEFFRCLVQVLWCFYGVVFGGMGVFSAV